MRKAWMRNAAMLILPAVFMLPAQSAGAETTAIPIPVEISETTCATTVSDDGWTLGFDGGVRNPFRWRAGDDSAELFSDWSGVLSGASANAALYRGDFGPRPPYGWWTSTGGVIDITDPLPANFVASAVGRHSIVGTWSAADGVHFGVWDERYGFSDLGNIGGVLGFVTAVNQADQFIGSRTTAQGRVRGFFWDRSIGIVHLGTIFAPSSAIEPVALSDSGLVAGASSSSTGLETRVFIWSLTSGMSAIGPSDARLVPTAINSSGTVVGSRPVGNPYGTGWKWTSSGGYQESYPGPATDINEHGQVIGYSIGGAWFANSAGMPAMLGGYDSFALDINDAGIAVGCQRPVSESPEHQAVAWTVDTPVQVHWSAAEYARIQELMAHYGMNYDELTKFGVYAAAFVNAMTPTANPTPVTVAPPGTAQTQTITWYPNDIELLEAVKHRWVLDDEGAHRWGYMILNYFAILQGA